MSVCSTSMDHREIDGHVSRAEERRVLADLSGFPNIAAMLAFDEISKKNRKKNNRRRKKKKKCEAQIDTEQYHQKLGQVQVTEGPILQELVILSDDSDGEVMEKSPSFKMDGGETMRSIEVKKTRESGQEEEERGNNVGVGIVNQKVSNGHVSKVNEYQMLADLTDFPNLASMLAFEASWRKNRKKKKNKKRKIEIGAQNDPEQSHLKPGQMQLTEGPNHQVLVILSDDSDGEVTNKNHSCKMDIKETMQSTEVKRMRESSKEEEERSNDNHQASNGHISKVDEYRMLADLTDFPNLASMLAFEATWRKNRKKKKKNKKRKIEIRAQNDTEQHHQKPEQVAATEAPKLQEVATLQDSNDNGGIKNGQSCEINGEDATELREGKKKQNNNDDEEEEKGNNVGVQSADHKVGNGHISKADEYKMLMDLTDFPNLAALLAFEASRSKNRKKKKNKKNKIEFEVPNNMVDVAKEKTQTNTCKAVETTNTLKVNDNVGSDVIADLYISKSQEDTVNTVEEDKRADSSKEMIPFQPKPVKSMDEILPRKLLCHPRYFNHPESSRVMAEDDHTAVNHTKQRKKKSCFVCGSLKHNGTNCKQVIDCSFCCGRGHLANDCPEKHVVKDESSKICLRCGDSGHDLFSCSNDYSYDDLKEIQCFVCKAFGHLCCVDYMVKDPRLHRVDDSKISQP